MKIRELMKEVDKLNIQDKADIIALANIDGEECEFEIIGIHQEGVPYIELEIQKWKK